MTTVASPVSTRDQAYALIEARLGAGISCKSELDEIGGAVLADVLLDLERRFDIGIDPDEVIPGTIDTLLSLTVRRAEGEASRRLYHWDDERLKRNLPYFGGRPRLVPLPATSAPEPLVLAIPPWPETPPQTRTACAAPTDEAWDAAITLYAREERRRRWMLFAAFVVLPFCIGAGCVWLRQLGVL
jgi:hypothetical protein